MIIIYNNWSQINKQICYFIEFNILPNLLAHSISLIYFSNDESKYYFNSVYNNVRSYINICNEDRELVIYILKNILKNKYQLKIIKYNPLIIKRID